MNFSQLQKKGESEFWTAYNNSNQIYKSRIKDLAEKPTIKEKNKGYRRNISKLQKSYEAEYTPQSKGVVEVSDNLNNNKPVQKYASIPESLKKALEDYGEDNALTMSQSFEQILAKVQSGMVELTPQEMKNSELPAKQKNDNLHLRIEQKSYDFIKYLSGFHKVTQDAVIICILNQELVEREQLNLSKKDAKDMFGKVAETLLKQTYESSLSCDLINLDFNSEKLELSQKISDLEQENLDKDKAIQDQQQIIQYLIMSQMGDKDDRSN